MLFLGLGRNLDIGLDQIRHHEHIRRIIHDDLAVVLGCGSNDAFLRVNDSLAHPPSLGVGQKLRVIHGILLSLATIELVEDRQHHHKDDKPDGQIFENAVIQGNSRCRKDARPQKFY